MEYCQSQTTRQREGSQGIRNATVKVRFPPCIFSGRPSPQRRSYSRCHESRRLRAANVLPAEIEPYLLFLLICASFGMYINSCTADWHSSIYFDSPPQYPCPCCWICPNSSPMSISTTLTPPMSCFDVDLPAPSPFVSVHLSVFTTSCTNTFGVIGLTVYNYKRCGPVRSYHRRVFDTLHAASANVIMWLHANHMLYLTPCARPRNLG